MPYFDLVLKSAQSLDLTTKQKFYVKIEGVARKKCKKCGHSYWPIRTKEKGFEQNRCFDCLFEVLADPATTILEKFF